MTDPHPYDEDPEQCIGDEVDPPWETVDESEGLEPADGE
jgi:hypothetical protein